MGALKLTIRPVDPKECFFQDVVLSSNKDLLEAMLSVDISFDGKSLTSSYHVEDQTLTSTFHGRGKYQPLVIHLGINKCRSYAASMSRVHFFYCKLVKKLSRYILSKVSVTSLLKNGLNEHSLFFPLQAR